MAITLEAARINAKLTQAELAQALGVTRARVSGWENGRINIPAIYLRRIAELSGVQENEIFLPVQSIENGLDAEDTKEG